MKLVIRTINEKKMILKITLDVDFDSIRGALRLTPIVYESNIF